MNALHIQIAGFQLNGEKNWVLISFYGIIISQEFIFVTDKIGLEIKLNLSRNEILKAKWDDLHQQNFNSTCCYEVAQDQAKCSLTKERAQTLHVTIENSVGDACYGTKIGPRAVIAIFDCVNNLGMVGWEWLQGCWWL